MSAPSEAEIVAAEFPTITLLDGSRLTLSGSLANTRLVEQRFGSIGGLLKVFNPMAEAIESDDPNAILGREFVTPVTDVLACFAPRGLRDPEELAERLDGRRIGEYMAALGDVIRLAFPAGDTQTPAQTAGDGPGNGQGQWATIPPDPPAWRPMTDSPGVPSGTPPPSPSAAPTPSSGG